jgi:hypothetical protein
MKNYWLGALERRRRRRKGEKDKKIDAGKKEYAVYRLATAKLAGRLVFSL